MAATKINIPTPMRELRVRGFIRTEHRSLSGVASAFDTDRESTPQHCVRTRALLASCRCVNASDSNREEQQPKPSVAQ
jgi:hypothetical protein